MSFIGFISAAGLLKQVKRAGWVVAGIQDGESVADHSFRLALLCMVLDEKLQLDTAKVLKMALIHDLAEGLVGDIITERGDQMVSSPEQKSTAEYEALKNIFAEIDDGKKYLELWCEYEYGHSREAALVKELDKLEMAAQALEYEGRVAPERLDEFWKNAQKYIHNPQLCLLLKDLEQQRHSNTALAAPQESLR